MEETCLSFKRRTGSPKYTNTLTFHKNSYDPVVYFMTNLVSRLFDLAHCKLNCGLLQVITEKENKKLSCGFSMPGVQGSRVSQVGASIQMKLSYMCQHPSAH